LKITISKTPPHKLPQIIEMTFLSSTSTRRRSIGF